MALAQDLKKTVTDTTPVYAAVGAADLAVEKVREARVRATAARADLALDKLQARAVQRATEATEQAQQVPALALNRGLELAGRAAESYGAFAARGEKLVTRVRNQKATKDLLAQAETTVALGKGAVTTMRKAVDDIERSAKATLTTGRREAATVVDAAVEAAVEAATEEAKEVKTTATTSARATRSAAKRTTTTTRKRAAGTSAATKRATTGAKKTAAATKKAAEATAAKVGD
ncbi:MAG TPA: hypothetical protein VH915_10215 [Pedococcus sp.]|jgi:hypothetical protein